MEYISLINHGRSWKGRPQGMQPSCVILHTTGYGPALQRLDARVLAGEALDVDLAMAKRQADVLEYIPHYTVGRRGGIYQLVLGGDVAHHTGGGAPLRKRVSAWPMKNKLGHAVDIGMWKLLFTTHHETYGAPGDLPVWPSPNAVSIGIDLIESPSHSYPSAQVTGLAALLVEVCKAHDIPVGHVFTHSMIDPYNRTSKRGIGWDLTPSFPLQAVLDVVAGRLQ